jgi:hypothetical protein
MSEASAPSRYSSLRGYGISRPGADVRLGPIALKKSKIERLGKSREGRLLDISAAARLSKTKCDGPWLRLCKSMWSLTSPRVERISGPEEYGSSAKKDFSNTIGREWSSLRWNAE